MHYPDFKLIKYISQTKPEVSTFIWICFNLWTRYLNKLRLLSKATRCGWYVGKVAIVHLCISNFGMAGPRILGSCPSVKMLWFGYRNNIFNDKCKEHPYALCDSHHFYGTKIVSQQYITYYHCSSCCHFYWLLWWLVAASAITCNCKTIVHAIMAFDCSFTLK